MVRSTNRRIETTVKSTDFMAQKPSLPKGTRDFSPAEIAKRNFILNTIRKQFELFGFRPIETPSFENLETLMGKYGEEGDRLIFKILNSGDYLSKIDPELYAQQDSKKLTSHISQKALRYDLTVPFARYVVMHQNEIDFPFKRYQIQPVWRADRPQKGRFREFYQCDADVVGNSSLLQEVELTLLYDAVFKDLGFDKVTIKLNHRKILSGMAQLIGAGDQITDFTTALDKLDKIGEEGVVKELESKGFSEDMLSKARSFFSIKGSNEVKIEQLSSLFADSEEGKEGLQEMEYLLKSIQEAGLSKAELEIDVTLARGLNYYTGVIFEVEAPEDVKIGSIGGGGRYDDLTGIFGLKDVSGVGISFGLDRIFLVMDELGLFPEKLANELDVLCLNFGEVEAMAALKLVQQLREAGLRSDLYPTAAKIQKQMKYANNRSVSYVISIGENELASREFLVKNMESGEQQSFPLSEVGRFVQSY